MVNIRKHAFSPTKIESVEPIFYDKGSILSNLTFSTLFLETSKREKTESKSKRD